MKKTVAFMLAVVLLTGLLGTVSLAENPEILGKWYFCEYEDLDNYPGRVFRANGVPDGAGGSPVWFAVYTDGENLIAVINRGGSSEQYSGCTWENGVLTIGFSEYVLENGKLVNRLEYDGAVHAVLTYARNPQETQVAGSVSPIYSGVLTPADFNGAWDIVKYGMNGAFMDAGELNIQGGAVIKDGVMTITWTRDGVEKSFEIVFDPGLNDGRLYTVVDNSISYIVSLLSDHTILLNVGLYQSEWVFRRRDAVSEDVVRITDEAFEQAFAGNEDWYASEESRNLLARMLMEAAVQNGADPALISAGGDFCLCSLAGAPLLVCEGAGPAGHYIFSVGRGVDYRDQLPFVYYCWSESLAYKSADPAVSLVGNYVEEVLSPLTGSQIWKVEISSAVAAQ